MLCGHLREGRDGQAGAPIVNRRDTDTGLESGVEMDRDKEEDHETEGFPFRIESYPASVVAGLLNHPRLDGGSRERRVLGR